MARNTAAQNTAPEVEENDAPEVQEDPWAAIEEVSLVEEKAPDARLVDMLKRSEDVRVKGGDAIGFKLTVANGEVAKSRIAEIRKAGGKQYANCGVGIQRTDNKNGSVTIVFKARKRRESASNGTGEGTGSE